MTQTQRELLSCTVGAALVFALLWQGGLLAAGEPPTAEVGIKAAPAPAAAIPKAPVLTFVEARKRGLDKHTMPRVHNTLYTEDGRKLLAFDTGKGYVLYRFSKGKRVAAPDGLYKIRGGGQLRAKGGKIDWADHTIQIRHPNPAYVGVPVPVAQRESGRKT